MPTIVVLVTIALGIRMVGVVANPLGCRLLFNDLASKVVVANSVFVGELVEFNLTTSDQPLASVQWVAVFHVGAVHKGRLMTTADREIVSVVGSKPAQVNASEERKDHQGNDAGPCEDWKDLEVGQSYFVFLNGSSGSFLLDLEMVVYWASGSPHEFSKMASKKVKRYSCETCGKSNYVAKISTNPISHLCSATVDLLTNHINMHSYINICLSTQVGHLITYNLSTYIPQAYICQITYQ